MKSLCHEVRMNQKSHSVSVSLMFVFIFATAAIILASVLNKNSQLLTLKFGNDSNSFVKCQVFSNKNS